MECASVRCAKRCQMSISLDVVLIYASTVALCGASFMKSPTNKAVIAGQRMEMECQTDNHSMFRKWDFLQTGNVSIRMIARNDNTNIEIVPNIGISGFGVDVDHNGSVLLYSNSTETMDAGVYICHGETGEKGSTEFKYSAQLIVLESEPKCETNLTATTSLSDGDYIWMECRVNFTGNWPPTMEWRQHPLNGNNNEGRLVSAETKTNSSITSTLVVLIDSTNYVSYYSCRTYFTWHNGSLRTNATNVPNFSRTWRTNSTVYLNTMQTTSSFTTTVTGGTTAQYYNTESVLLLFGVLSAALFLVMIATIVACCVIIRRKTAEWMAKVVSTYENRERPRSTRNSLMFSRDTLRRQTKSLDQQVGCREREPSEGYTSVDDLEEECNQAAGERPTTSGTPKYTSVFKKSPPVPSAPRPEPVASALYSLAVEDDVVLDYATLRKTIDPPKWDNNHDSAESESESEDLK